MNVKATLFYTFFAKVAIAAVDTTKNPDDDLISKIVPIIGNGLRLVENTHFFREGSTYFFRIIFILFKRLRYPYC